MKTKFEAGMKYCNENSQTELHKTVAFYRDVLQFEVEEQTIDSPTVSRTIEFNSVTTLFGWIAYIIIPKRTDCNLKYRMSRKG